LFVPNRLEEFENKLSRRLLHNFGKTLFLNYSYLDWLVVKLRSTRKHKFSPAALRSHYGQRIFSQILIVKIFLIFIKTDYAYEKIITFFMPTILTMIVYMTVTKVFSEKLLDRNSEKKDLRVGDNVKYTLTMKIGRIVKKSLQERALKASLITLFATTSVLYFDKEIETLLVNELFNELCVNKKPDGKLKILCDIAKEYALNSHSKFMKEVIITSKLSDQHKVDLLKIKLDFLINVEYVGKKRFMIVSIIVIIITVSASVTGGFALILDALYRLFKEGKISRAVYEQILEVVAKRWIKVPVNLDDFI
jgi:hypothetical protein